MVEVRSWYGVKGGDKEREKEMFEVADQMTCFQIQTILWKELSKFGKS